MVGGIGGGRVLMVMLEGGGGDDGHDVGGKGSNGDQHQPEQV